MKKMNYGKFLETIDKFNNGVVSEQFMKSQIEFFSKINPNAPLDFERRTSLFCAQFEPTASGSMDFTPSCGGKISKKFTIAEDVYDYNREYND